VPRRSLASPMRLLTTGRTGPARGGGRKRKGSPHWRPQEVRWCARPRRSMAFPRSAPRPAEDATPEIAAFGDQAPRACRPICRRRDSHASCAERRAFLAWPWIGFSARSSWIVPTESAPLLVRARPPRPLIRTACRRSRKRGAHAGKRGLRRRLPVLDGRRASSRRLSFADMVRT
jgi:hypothetical protein